MMSNKEFRELELKASIAPSQSQWPTEHLHWQRLGAAADEARSRLGKFLEAVDETGVDGRLSREGKAEERKKAAVKALAAFDGSKTLEHARESVASVMASWEGKITKLVQPAKDHGEAVTHAQIRDRLSSMKDTKERMSFLERHGADPTLANAVLISALFPLWPERCRIGLRSVQGRGACASARGHRGEDRPGEGPARGRGRLGKSEGQDCFRRRIRKKLEWLCQRCGLRLSPSTPPSEVRRLFASASHNKALALLPPDPLVPEHLSPEAPFRSTVCPKRNSFLGKERYNRAWKSSEQATEDFHACLYSLRDHPHGSGWSRRLLGAP